MMFKANYSATTKQFLLEKCVFCEFVKNSPELSELESADEELYRTHLMVAHGLQR
jgi:hypothetical protein